MLVLFEALYCCMHVYMCLFLIIGGDVCMYVYVYFKDYLRYMLMDVLYEHIEVCDIYYHM